MKLALCVGTAVWLAVAIPSTAQENIETQQIIDALLPLDMEGRRVKGARSLDGAFDNSRGVTVFEGKEVPFINLQIGFEYDSDTLTNDAILTLEKLAAALQDPAFSESEFRIVGHTDAVGGADYNQDLSERRAISVVTYLNRQHGIEYSRFMTSGAGKSQLLEGMAGEDERNRRVEVQNVSDVSGN